MKSGCSFATHTLLRMVLGAALLTLGALVALPAPVAGAHDASSTALNAPVRPPNVTLGERSPVPLDDTYPTTTVDEGASGLVTLTVSLGVMSVVGLASGLWFLATVPTRPDE